MQLGTENFQSRRVRDATSNITAERLSKSIRNITPPQHSTMSSKRKRAGGVKSYAEDEDDLDSVEKAPASKQVKTSKGKKPVDLEMQRDSDGIPYWEV